MRLFWILQPERFIDGGLLGADLTMSALDVRGLFSGKILQSPVINDIEFHRNSGEDRKTIELKMRSDTFHL